MTQVLLKIIARLLVPDRCVLCNEEGSGLCGSCRETTLTRRVSSCYLCNARTQNNQVCTRCQSRTPLRRLDVLWRLDAPAEQVVYGVKYDGREDTAQAIAYQIALLKLSKFDMITFVPDTPSRRRDRGFIAPQLIARELGRILGIPVQNTLRRDWHTPQMGAGRTTRWKQVKGNFTVKHPVIVENKRILIIDDVVTTGATMTEVATTLRKAGSATLYGLAIAKK